jgi:hypothetical protein
MSGQLIAMVRWVCSALFAGLVLTLLLPGCNRDDSYQSVSGSVTFRGEPIRAGTIQFFTLGDRPVLFAGATIARGKYVVPMDHGLKPGKYLVRISSTERLPNTEGADPSMNPFRVRERLPSKYNTESALTIEFSAGKRGPFNFDLD